MRRLLAVLMAAVMTFTLAAPAMAQDTPKSKDTVILYTNDVHSYIDGDVSYDVIAALKDQLKTQYEHVLLVDAGDHIQGTAYGSMDRGETIIELMNAAGYDLATLGNHEFDYGMDGCMNVTEWADYPYVSCNFCHLQDGVRGSTVLEPYSLFTFGEKTIAFVGITTPETLNNVVPATFQDENGTYIYDIAGGEDGQALYDAVQKAIDQAKDAGADMVIGLGHLGEDYSVNSWLSRNVIANTHGLNAMIDGHSHSTIEGQTETDKDGCPVLLTQTGEYFNRIGMMIIDDETNAITTRLLETEDLADLVPDDEVEAIKNGWLDEIEDRLGQVIGYAQVTLDNYDAAGNRLARLQETNSGDFSSDALYYLFDEMEMDVDVALMNGGGVRNRAISGEMTYFTCKEIHTFGNVACLLTVTGQQLLDALEWGAQGVGIYEDGSFMHPSGLTYQVDPSIPPTVQADEKGIWTGAPTGEYRVHDVKIYNKETGSWEALDLEAEYNLAGYNYTLRDLGGGFAMFDGAVNVLDYVMEDYMVLANYIQAFEDGVVGASNSPLSAKYPGFVVDYGTINGSGRITITSAADWDESKELYVEGVRVTPENAGDVLGDGTVRFDASTSTLTLTDATIHNDEGHGIYAVGMDLTIRGVDTPAPGSNDIHGTSTTIYYEDEDGPASYSEPGCGIYSEGDRESGQIGSVTLTGTLGQISSYDAEPIYSYHDISICGSVDRIVCINESDDYFPFHNAVDSIFSNVSVSGSVNEIIALGTGIHASQNVSITGSIGTIEAGITGITSTGDILVSGTVDEILSGAAGMGGCGIEAISTYDWDENLDPILVGGNVSIPGSISSITADYMGIFAEQTLFIGGNDMKIAVTNEFDAWAVSAGKTLTIEGTVTLPKDNRIGPDEYGCPTVLDADGLPARKISIGSNLIVIFDASPSIEKIPDQDLTIGSLAVKPQDPTAEGGVFQGWYTDPACTDETVFDFSVPVTDHVTLYAKWGHAVCVDDNCDHRCDFCRIVLTQCADLDPMDHYCDICEEVLSECVDAGHDHRCDICGTFPFYPDEDWDAICDAEGCGAAEVNIESKFTSLSYTQGTDAAFLSGELEVSAETYVDGLIPAGEVALTWRDSDLTYKATLDEAGKAVIAFRDLPLEFLLNDCDISFTPADSRFMTGEDRNALSYETMFVSVDPGESASCTINGINAETLLLFPETEVTVVLSGPSSSYTVDFVGTSAAPTLEKDGNTLRFTLPAMDNEWDSDCVELAVVWDFGLTVAGIPVTSENYTDVLGDGTVSYEPASKTLTLRNADIHVTSGNYGIRSYGLLNIVLEGENTVICDGVYGLHSKDDVVISGDGSLTVKAADVGIYIAGGAEVGGLTLIENVVLVAEGGGVTSGNSYGVRVDDVLSVQDNAVLTAIGGTAPDRSCGIYAYDILELSGKASVTAVSGDLPNEIGTDCTGVRTTHVILNGGTLISTGGTGNTSNGIFTRTFEMNGGTVKAVAGVTDGPSVGLQATKSFLLTDGTVIARGQKAGMDQSCGLLVSNGTLDLHGGVIDAQGGEANFSYGTKATYMNITGGEITSRGSKGVWCSDGISVENDLTVSGGTITTFADEAETFSYGFQAFKANISGGTITSTASAANGSFGLWAFDLIQITGGELDLTAQNGNAMYSYTGIELHRDLGVLAPAGGRISNHDNWMVIDSKEAPADHVEIGLKPPAPTGPVSKPTINPNPVVAPTRPADRFTDLDENAWYHEAVDYVLSNGLMSGVSGDKFDPNGTTSRAMIAAILWRLEGAGVVNGAMNFRDVDQNAWYAEAVRWAAAQGIVNGYDAETFGPNDPVTREQLAAILYRYAQSKGKGFTGSWMFLLDYADRAEISDWAYEAMCWMTMKGVMSDTGSGMLEPKASSTRAQAAAMLQRFSEVQ